MNRTAHRGAPGKGKRSRGNTWEVIETAFLRGYDYVEVDIQQTSDGGFVLHHGPRLRDGSRIGALPLAEVLTRDPSLMTLPELIERSVPQRLHLDMKDVDPEHLAIITGRLLNAHHHSHISLRVSSFYADDLIAWHSVRPHDHLFINLGLRNNGEWKELFQLIHDGIASSVSIERRLAVIFWPFIGLADEKSLYTVNSGFLMPIYKALGYTNIISDVLEPAHLADYREEEA